MLLLVVTLDNVHVNKPLCLDHRLSSFRLLESQLPLYSLVQYRDTDPFLEHSEIQTSR